jgi:FHS family L-fucose permease-like MFS transporter
MIDVMDKHFQNELHLTLAQSAWVQFAHYLGYFLMSLPAGWLAIRLGYKGGIIAGLLMVALGGVWFLPATHIAKFWAFLLGVCVIASGLTFLETIANPYTTVLGEPKYGPMRINLAQSCNGVGWIFGPIAGRMYFYSTDAAGQSTGAQTLYIPYVAVAGLVIFLAAIFYFANVPDIKTEDDYHLDDATPGVSHSIWKHPHFVLAVAAQFFYVAAQAGIFSFFINYMTSQVPPIPESWNSGFMKGLFSTGPDGLLHISDAGGSTLASVGFICFLLGRVSGSALLKKFAAHKVLGLYGVLNVLICFLIFSKLGWLSVLCVFLSYFFMSIMFPTIFALGIFGLGVRAKRASGYIVMAIMGGAILPKLMGHVADKYDMSRGFIVPLFCFAFVAFYAFGWRRFSRGNGMKQPGAVVETAART